MKREKNIRFPLFRERFLQLKGERTTVEFAQVLGMSRATVGFYESGQRIPDALGIKKICKTCGVSADWLLGISTVKTSDTTTQAICQATGLSEKAVEQVLSLEKLQLDSLEYLLNRTEFDCILLSLGLFRAPKTLDVFVEVESYYTGLGMKLRQSGEDGNFAQPDPIQAIQYDIVSSLIMILKSVEADFLEKYKKEYAEPARKSLEASKKEG